jgi:hypothetical protein
MKLRIGIALLFSALVGVAGHSVPATQQLPLFDLLVTTASIVFGVSGAWIALVHRTELESSKAQSGRFRNLVRAMLASGATIAIVLLVRASQAITSTHPWVGQVELPWLRGIAFGTWTFLALVQFWSMFAMLPSALHAQGEISGRRAHQRLMASLPPEQKPAE